MDSLNEVKTLLSKFAISENSIDAILLELDKEPKLLELLKNEEVADEIRRFHEIVTSVKSKNTLSKL